MTLKRWLIAVALVLIAALVQSYFWVPTYERQSTGNPARLSKYIDASIGELMADGELAVGGESPTRLRRHEVAMYWDVKTVRSLPNYRIYVEIEDGRQGIFDLKPYLDRGVVRELRNVHYFNQVSILFGTVTWPNEQDIAPETLLAEMLPVEQTNPVGIEM